jgi:hypothetical protein
MAILGWFATLMVTVSFGVAAADAIDAVHPRGSGMLTKCRDWLVASTCRTYHHIRLPSRIAVGDTITVSFGSAPKEYGFFVARIELEGDQCTIFSEATGDRHGMDKINITPCHPAGPAR